MLLSFHQVLVGLLVQPERKVGDETVTGIIKLGPA
jgi:hypothetical protein